MTKHTIFLAPVLAGLLSASGCAVVIGNDLTESGFAEAVAEADGDEIRLAREVENRLAADTQLREARLRATAQGEVVTLHGEVENMQLLERAVELAGAVPDVEVVKLNVSVVRD